MAAGAVRIDGLRELKKASKAAGKETDKAVNAALRMAAAPVQATAQRLAVGIQAGTKWSKMRIGVTTTKVYVAPSGRRKTGTPRPNFADRLAARSLEPALAQNEAEVMRLMEHALDQVADAFEKGI